MHIAQYTVLACHSLIPVPAVGSTCAPTGSGFHFHFSSQAQCQYGNKGKMFIWKNKTFLFKSIAYRYLLTAAERSMFPLKPAATQLLLRPLAKLTYQSQAVVCR